MSKSFVGRKRELARMFELWNGVKSGDGPALLRLDGDAGFGKTQLLQEFYAQLVVEERGGKHWPSELKRSGFNLELNPDVNEVHETEGAPFLWWGFRLSDPEERNGKPDSLSNTELDLLRTYTRHAENAAKSMAANIGTGKKVLIGLLKQVPLVGLGVEVLEQASDALDRWDNHVRLAREGRINAASDFETRKRLYLDALLGTFEVFFAHHKSKPQPAVVVIDDAHWLRTDSVEIDLVERLFAKAQHERWSVLFVVTTRPTIDGRFRELVDQFTATKEKIRIERLDEADQLFSDALPDLPKADVDFLSSRADGNPLTALQIILLIEEDPGTLVDGETANGLSEAGREVFLETTFLFDRIVEERLRRAKPAVQYAVGLCSIQGTRFLDEIGEDLDLEMRTGSIARIISEASFKPALEEAADPYGLVARAKDGILSFPHSSYRVQAGKRLTRLTGRKEGELRLALKRCLAKAVAKYAGDFDNKKRRLLADLGFAAFKNPENKDEATATLEFIRLKLSASYADPDDLLEFDFSDIADCVIMNGKLLKKAERGLNISDISDVVSGLSYRHPSAALLIQIYIELAFEGGLNDLTELGKQVISSSMLQDAASHSEDDWVKYSSLLIDTAHIRKQISDLSTYDEGVFFHRTMVRGNSTDDVLLQSNVTSLLDLNDRWIEDPTLGERTDFVDLLVYRRETSCQTHRHDVIFSPIILFSLLNRDFDNIVELGFNIENTIPDGDRVGYARRYLDKMITFLESRCPCTQGPAAVLHCNDPLADHNFDELLARMRSTWNHL